MNVSFARSAAALLLLVAAGSALPAMAQISVRGGNPLMSITTGTAGGQPVAVTNVASSLSWKKQTVIAKITVATTCPGQRFSLSVLATNLSAGVAAPQVTLSNGMLAANFVINIPTGGSANKTCTLQYTASATFAQGNSTELGNDVHQVTYTLVAQ